MQNNARPSVLKLNFNLSSWLEQRLTNISKEQGLILGPRESRQGTHASTESQGPGLLVFVIQNETQCPGREQKEK